MQSSTSQHFPYVRRRRSPSRRRRLLSSPPPLSILCRCCLKLISTLPLTNQYHFYLFTLLVILELCIQNTTSSSLSPKKLQNHTVKRHKAFQESNITQWEYEKIELSATEVCLLYRLSKGKMFLAIGDMVHGKLTFHLLSLDLHQTQKSSCPLMAILIGLMGSCGGTKKVGYL